jgi:hypothetical protein
MRHAVTQRHGTKGLQFLAKYGLRWKAALRHCIRSVSPVIHCQHCRVCHILILANFLLEPPYATGCAGLETRVLVDRIGTGGNTSGRQWMYPLRT